MDHSENQRLMNNLEIEELENTVEDSSSSSGEYNVIQWLQALDLQVIGACRADERLKPLLKLNVTTGAAEDRLLAHLNQNFEPSEVGMLARCLCIPLVSMRVGKIRKQGTLLCPTSTRGNLNLTILPTSELRISFIGDDGVTDRVGVFCTESDCAAVEVKDIMADESGRSFLISIPGGRTSYFWCSEKSKLLGDELRRKMRDLLKKKPTLAELTGIDESRLNSFTNHLRGYLLGSAATNVQASSVISRDPSTDGSVDSSELGCSGQIPVTSQKPPHTKTRLISSLCPMPSAVNDSKLRNSSLVSLSGDMQRYHIDSYLTCVDSQLAGTRSSMDGPSSTCAEENKTRKETCPNILESLVALPPSRGPAAANPLLDPTVLSPYYCMCPPAVSTLQYSVGTPHMPILSTESLPPLSSLSPSCPSSILTLKSPLASDISCLDLPPLLPDPLIRLPLSLATSQQVPSFTPLMCDPIVHIPVIDVCSSGQGYLVSAGGPALTSAIPPLHPNLVNPIIQDTESVVEKSARETLRLLINSSNQPGSQLINLLPPVLSRNEETHDMLVAGSRGLYSGTVDVETIANGFAIKGLVSLSEKPIGLVNQKQTSIENLVFPIEKNDLSGETSLDDGRIVPEEEKKNG